MPERVNKIIEYLIKEFVQHTEQKLPDLKTISKTLLKKGYTEPEIEKAVEWIRMFIDKSEVNSSPLSDQSYPALRLLSPSELTYFSSDSYAYLVQLQVLRLITPLQAEQIIEHCYLMGLVRIELDDLKSIVFQFLVQKHSAFNNSKTFYHPGNDKIN
jgi:uncharacterized protein Smg (DUF494 family)